MHLVLSRVDLADFLTHSIVSERCDGDRHQQLGYATRRTAAPMEHVHHWHTNIRPETLAAHIELFNVTLLQALYHNCWKHA